MHLASPKFGLAQSIRRSRRTRQLHRGSQRTQLRKRAHPTEAGADLIAHARDLLERDANTQIAMRRFTDGWLGRVRIGTSMSRTDVRTAAGFATAENGSPATRI